MAIIELLGRIIFGGFFLNSAYGHFKHTDMMAGYAASKGVKNPKVAIRGSGLLLLIGGLSIITGMFPGIGIISLLLFLIPVTYKMHAFWKDTDPAQKANNRINFGKNVALIGALLMLAYSAAHWPYVL